ncbi:hypothetical protein A9Q94_03000 [Rhodobacterales bacterium 56_14_T64]|nr:hypothetical protein A9Q94_03000 [Rhodobacterales bacterium 56_14_T64]
MAPFFCAPSLFFAVKSGGAPNNVHLQHIFADATCAKSLSYYCDSAHATIYAALRQFSLRNNVAHTAARR